MTDIEAVEFTDPSCSYAWGTEPKYRRLRWQYGDRLRWRRVLVGIIARDWHAHYGIALDSEEMRARQCAYWADVSGLTGMPYPAPVRHAMEWSEDACRVVKAAELQGPEVAERVLRRLRESWFVDGAPADTIGRGLDLAAGTPGLDLDRMAADLAGPPVEQAYRDDWEEARRPSDYVLNLADGRVGFGKAREHNGRMRYGLPCLVLTGSAGEATIAGLREWSDWENALETVAPGAVAAARPLPTPAEAFATWPTLAAAELEFLCGPGAQPPPGVVRHRWEGGLLWRTPEAAAVTEATARPLTGTLGGDDGAPASRCAR